MYTETWYGNNSRFFLSRILIVIKFHYRLHCLSLHLRIGWWKDKWEI